MEMFTKKGHYFAEAHKKLIDLASSVVRTSVTIENSVIGMTRIYHLHRLKYTGVVLAINDTNNCLKIIKCNLEKNLKNIKLPHNLFSWHLKHFLERTKMHDTRFINDLVAAHHSDLDLIKLKVDLGTIIDLFDSFCYNISTKAKMEDFEAKLGGIFKLLKLQGSLLNEKKYNDIVANKLHMQIKFFNLDKGNLMAKWNEQLNDIRDECNDSKLKKYPIQLRYVRQFEGARVEQLEKEIENEDNDYLFQIRDYKNKYIREQDCFAHLSQAYDVEIERMKVKIDEVIYKYGIDYELYDLVISRTKAELEEINGHIKKYHEKYEFYKSEISKHIAKQEAMEAERAWRAMIEGLGEEEEEDAKSKKGKKKGKGKDKKKAKAETKHDKNDENKKEKAPKGKPKKKKV